VREYKSVSESAAGTMENEAPSMLANALEIVGRVEHASHLMK
jgi:hypothetical protein